MANNYGKLFGSILESSICKEPVATRWIWCAMIAAKDKDGIVEGTPDGLANRFRVSESELETAFASFLSPDHRSKSRAADGRRIEVVVKVDSAGVEHHVGWRVINHAYYRDLLASDRGQTGMTPGEKREDDAERQRKSRAARKALETEFSAAFEKFYAMYPSQYDKPGCWQVWCEMDLDKEAAKVIAGLEYQFGGTHYGDEFHRQFGKPTEAQYTTRPKKWLEARAWADALERKRRDDGARAAGRRG